MIIYRLSTTEYCSDLSGKGAEIFGGRWNSKGLALLYTCESRALCITEIAVHTPLGIVPLDYSLCTIKIPANSSILEINIDELPFDWKSFPHSESTQFLGNKFIREKKHLVLKVPSVVPGEYNYLINPSHPEFSKVTILKTEGFLFDERLFK
jgi:RES domain-containing protein